MNAHPFRKHHQLSHSPTQFLSTTHSLITPFPKHQFQVYAGYALGTPTMPSVLQPRKENGDYYPCRCSGAMLPNASGHHKMVCRNSGMKGAHDHIEDEFVSVTRPAHIQCTSSKSIVPKHADSNHQGDILITLSPANRPFVLDVSVVHPYTGSGVFEVDAPQHACDEKIRTSENTNRLTNPKVTTFSPPLALLTAASTRTSSAFSILLPTPKQNTLSSTFNPTKTSRCLRATASLESRDASELLSPEPSPTALSHAPRMDFDDTMPPTDQRSKQQINASTSQ